MTKENRLSLDVSVPLLGEAASEEEPQRSGWLRGLLRGFGFGRNAGPSLRETFEELIEQREERALPIAPGERALLEKALSAGQLTAYDVMIPRADIAGVEAGVTLDALIALIATEAHSRLPVYRETLDDVISRKSTRLNSSH